MQFRKNPWQQEKRESGPIAWKRMAIALMGALVTEHRGAVPRY